MASSVDTEQLRELAEKTFDTARLAWIELISSNSFRRSVTDLVSLCYDVLAGSTVDLSETKKGEEVVRKDQVGMTAEYVGFSLPPTLEMNKAFQGRTQPRNRRRCHHNHRPNNNNKNAEGNPCSREDERKHRGSQAGAKEGIEDVVNSCLEAVGSPQRLQLRRSRLPFCLTVSSSC